MDDEAIKDIAAQLEGAARIEDAKFYLDWYSKKYDSKVLVANRAALLHLAAFLLRGAISETVEWAPTFKNDEAEPFVQVIDQREEWEREPTEEEVFKTSSWEGIGCWSFVVLIIFLSIVGLVTVLKWIF